MLISFFIIKAALPCFAYQGHCSWKTDQVWSRIYWYNQWPKNGFLGRWTGICTLYVLYDWFMCTHYVFTYRLAPLIWPTRCSCLFLLVVIKVLFIFILWRTFLLLFFSIQDILIIRRRNHITAASSFFSNCLLVVQHSHPYVKTGMIYAFITFIFVSIVIFLHFSIRCNSLKVSFAWPTLFLISQFASRVWCYRKPKVLKTFHVFAVIHSVLDMFNFRPIFLNYYWQPYLKLFVGLFLILPLMLHHLHTLGW